jgi:uncharacterized protein (DUF1800 family)
LLWRAGFGPAPGQAEELAKLGLEGAVYSLTRPGGAELRGPTPTDDAGLPLAPADKAHHDQLSWLDRMLRSSQPLVERIAYIFHDWFATSNASVSHSGNMLAQIDKFRTLGLGSFHDLLVAVTGDPAMLSWLDGIHNYKGHLNENYAREMMELFTLGADRGAYTESDVRGMMRALTGWRAFTTGPNTGNVFAFQDGYHEHSVKTIFGASGDFNYLDACRMAVHHPAHPSFFVRKLWSYFISELPSAETQADLERIYTSSGFVVRPVVERILMDPALYTGQPIVKPPVVFLVGMLRSVRPRIDTVRWADLCAQAGQRLLNPPDVDGWDFSRWLTTQTVRGRWLLVHECLNALKLDPAAATYDGNEAADAAVARALAFWQLREVSPETRAELERFASEVLAPLTSTSERSRLAAMRQNALRHLVAVSPDYQIA